MTVSCFSGASTIEVITSRGMLAPVRLRNPHSLLPARVIAGHRPASGVYRPLGSSPGLQLDVLSNCSSRLEATPDFSVIFLWQAFCIDRLRHIFRKAVANFTPRRPLRRADYFAAQC